MAAFPGRRPSDNRPAMMPGSRATGRRVVVAGLLAAVALVAASCGSNSSTPTGTPSPTTTPAVQQPPASGPAGGNAAPPNASAPPQTPSGTETPTQPPGGISAPGGTGPCVSANLNAHTGEPSGAAGTVGFPIVFTNTGSAPCVLDGFPGVSYADGPDSGPVGAPAARDGVPTGAVTLAPGASASALVMATDVDNYPTAQCNPVPVPGLRVYPPNDTDSLYVPYSGTACSLPSPETAQLRVRAVVAGDNGR